LPYDVDLRECGRNQSGLYALSSFFGLIDTCVNAEGTYSSPKRHSWTLPEQLCPTL